MGGLRGNELEKCANKANKQYRKDGTALILKVDTPIIYTSKGMVAKQSTVDFVGILKGGRFLAFDAKETAIKTSFPLKNIHEHQFNYLNIVESLGGLVFFLIHFKKVHPDKAFFTPLDLIKKYWMQDGRKSIPISEFKEDWLVPTTDYLINQIKLIDASV